jgi:hypothetical protein
MDTSSNKGVPANAFATFRIANIDVDFRAKGSNVLSLSLEKGHREKADYRIGSTKNELCFGSHARCFGKIGGLPSS